MMENSGDACEMAIGGYPEEIFLNLTAEERVAGECSICYLVSREPRECAVGHVFCTSCIVSWATGSSGASGKCPVCRSAGRYYRPAIGVRTWLHTKWVRCPHYGDSGSCPWTGILRELRHHRRAAHGSDYEQDKAELPLPMVLFQKNKFALLNERRRESGESLMGAQTSSPRGSRSANHANKGSNPRNSSAIRNSTEREIDIYASNPSSYLEQKTSINSQLPADCDLSSSYTNTSIRHEMLRDVDEIRHQLSQVSCSLSLLVQRMSNDQQRYTNYIREMPVGLKLAANDNNTSSGKAPDQPKPTSFIPEHLANGSKYSNKHSKMKPNKQ